MDEAASAAERTQAKEVRNGINQSAHLMSSWREQANGSMEVKEDQRSSRRKRTVINCTMKMIRHLGPVYRV
jgi:hypothetical protein